MEGVEEVKGDGLQVTRWGQGSSLFEQPQGGQVVFFIQFVYADEDPNIYFQRLRKEFGASRYMYIFNEVWVCTLSLID